MKTYTFTDETIRMYLASMRRMNVPAPNIRRAESALNDFKGTLEDLAAGGRLEEGEAVEGYRIIGNIDRT